MSTEHKEIEDVKTQLSFERMNICSKYYCNKTYRQQEVNIILLIDHTRKEYTIQNHLGKEQFVFKNSNWKKSVCVTRLIAYAADYAESKLNSKL
jgi:hypothetical protein